MVDFERLRFEIGLEFGEGSSELKKDAHVFSLSLGKYVMCVLSIKYFILRYVSTWFYYFL